MATRRRRPTRKAVTKRRVRRRSVSPDVWLWRKIRKWGKAQWRRAKRATHKAREAHRKAEAARPKPVTRAGTVAVSKAPPPGAAWLAGLAAYVRAQNLTDRANGKANDARNRANDLDHRRGQRHSTFVCYGHITPQRFATAAELNAHLEVGHPEPVRHAPGSESKPVRGVAPNRPPARPVGAQRPSSKPDTTKGSGVRGQQAAHKWAGEAMATLDEIGSARIQTVSQIKELMAGLEKVALQLEEAVTGFQHNASTSEQAPVDAGVLAQLDPAKEGAETIRAAVVGFLSAFDEYYAEDIREAQAGVRMENDALTR